MQVAFRAKVELLLIVGSFLEQRSHCRCLMSVGCCLHLCEITNSYSMYFIGYIIIGLLAGFIAGKIMRGGGFGVLLNLLIGVVGGILGGWLFALFGIAVSGLWGSFVTSVIGAVLLLWIASLFNRPQSDKDVSSNI